MKYHELDNFESGTITISLDAYHKEIKRLEESSNNLNERFDEYNRKIDSGRTVVIKGDQGFIDIVSDDDVAKLAIIQALQIICDAIDGLDINYMFNTPAELINHIKDMIKQYTPDR